ncbi:hypothetical protein EMCG_04327 [[Emmonsia] crescens]|uniref:Uncharacterized protein n=1 Tax=[Emmonsia] crescens TaxID=73230 RepID=A0A0G2J7K5_9EURO|nr:hypothetical protein EMCG_04327 [Emmonsia crescens UAMH 3008]
MAAITRVVAEPSGMALHFIVAMKDMEIGVKHLNTIKKLLDLENAQGQLYNGICDEHAIKVQPAYQKLAQDEVLAAISDQECSMDKIQVVLNNLRSANDVDATVKARIYECMLRHQNYRAYRAYRSECEKEANVNTMAAAVRSGSEERQ